MGEIKLSDVTVETQDRYAAEMSFGVRLTNVLKRINFPSREKMVIHYGTDWLSMGYTLRLAIEVTDTKSGAPTRLEHSTNVDNSMSDVELASRVFVLIAQFMVHEFMETFRYEGKILFDPHGTNTSHSEVFAAIENVASKHKTAKNSDIFSFVVTGYTKPQEWPKHNTGKHDTGRMFKGAMAKFKTTDKGPALLRPKPKKEPFHQKFSGAATNEHWKQKRGA